MPTLLVSIVLSPLFSFFIICYSIFFYKRLSKWRCAPFAQSYVRRSIRFMLTEATFVSSH
jgi:hypothetical protein